MGSVLPPTEGLCEPRTMNRPPTNTAMTAAPASKASRELPFMVGNLSRRTESTPL